MNDPVLPPIPPPADPDQHAPGVGRTLEENATRFRETTPEERLEPKIKPVIEPEGGGGDRSP